ncbi:hypothetical protein V8E36_007393 [Tilletia maclaganii]
MRCTDGISRNQRIMPTNSQSPSFPPHRRSSAGPSRSPSPVVFSYAAMRPSSSGSAGQQTDFSPDRQPASAAAAHSAPPPQQHHHGLPGLPPSSSSPEQIQSSSSLAASSSSSSSDLDRGPLALHRGRRNVHETAATGLVDTLSSTVFFEEAEEAPPPSLSNLMLKTHAQPRYYILKVAEQPAHGRLYGFTTRDKRNIDPTPVVSLQIMDEHDRLDLRAMTSPYLLVQVSIRAADGTDRSLVINPNNDEVVRSFEGVQVQNGTYVSEDKTTYFAFPGLSVRLAGRYRLYFSLISLAQGIIGSSAGRSSSHPSAAAGHRDSLDMGSDPIASVASEEFEVFAPRRFPGVMYSSPLTRRLAERGVRVHLRNRGNDNS